jgi:O-antigen ligase
VLQKVYPEEQRLRRRKTSFQRQVQQSFSLLALLAMLALVLLVLQGLLVLLVLLVLQGLLVLLVLLVLQGLLVLLVLPMLQVLLPLAAVLQSMTRRQANERQTAEQGLHSRTSTTGTSSRLHQVLYHYW